MDIKGTLEREFGLPVTVANDANCMLLGEVWAGAAKGYTDVIGVTLGTGVGGGILPGGVSAQQELLIDPLSENVGASVMPAFAEGLELKSAALQNDAGLVGDVYYFKKHHDLITRIKNKAAARPKAGESGCFCVSTFLLVVPNLFCHAEDGPGFGPAAVSSPSHCLFKPYYVNQG